MMPWAVSWRADPVGRVLADQHYNRQTPGADQFVPPGRCLVLTCPGAVWVTSWPDARYVKHAWAGAWVNSLFRREPECAVRASDLITAAVACSRWRWPLVPSHGIVTFVDPDEVRHKRDPGRCYLRAGWTLVGRTQAGLLVFQQLRVAMPTGDAPANAQLEAFA